MGKEWKGGLGPWEPGVLVKPGPNLLLGKVGRSIGHRCRAQGIELLSGARAHGQNERTLTLRSEPKSYCKILNTEKSKRNPCKIPWKETEIRR